MSNSIDTLSKNLGEMLSDIRHIREKTDIINEKVEKTNIATIIHGEKIDSAHKRIDTSEKNALKTAKEINDTIKTIKTKVESHETLKNKGLGIVSIIGILAGGIGVWIGKVIGIIF